MARSGQTQEIACADRARLSRFNAGDANARRLMEEGVSLQQSVGDPLLVNRRIRLLQVLRIGSTAPHCRALRLVRV